MSLGTVKDAVLAQIFCSAVMNDQCASSRADLPDHRTAASSKSLRIRHLLGHYIVWFSVDFQFRMKLEREE